MADKTVFDYTQAVSIDGTTHWLLIQPGNNSVDYNRINRSTFLGVTGQPADISTSQSLTNKTLDNTNILTLRDDRFTLQDSGDVTKQAQFQLSGITAGQTRVYTLPNATGTLADLATAQTFTNKTLTAPVINNGSITGTTITTDAIVGQSAATTGTVYGLSIASGKVGTNGVVTASITDGAVTPAKLQAGTGSSWTWQDWAPTLTNLSGGTITFAKYVQQGKTVFFRFLYTLAGANVSGSVRVTLPVAATVSTSASVVAGVIYLTDTGAATYGGLMEIFNANTVTILVSNTSSTYEGFSVLSSTVPFSWGNTDTIYISGTYEAA